MTTTTPIGKNAGVVIWPEQSGVEQYEMEHALLILKFSDAVSIEQNGKSISIPHYALKEVIKVLRDLQKGEGS